MTVTRSGDWWAIEVPDVAGTFSQARRLDQVEARAREAIALMTDTDQDVFDVAVDVRPDYDVAALIAQLGDSIASTKAAHTAESACRHQVVTQLHNLGFPNRDVAALIGLSHQRISQILTGSQP